MGADSSAAERSSQINSSLMSQYGAVGLPAVQGNLNYIQGALAQDGLPQYVQNAYAGARGGASEAASSELAGLRSRIAQNTGGQAGGGMLSGLAAALPAASASYQGELQKIGTTKALAGLDERNKLLGALTGQGASATNLSAGFGSLTNAGLGIAGNNPGAYPYVAGGLAAGSGLLGQYLTAQSNSPYNTSIRPGGTAGSGNWQGFGGVSYT